MPVVGFPLLVFGGFGVYFTRLHVSFGWLLVAVVGLIFILGRPLLMWIELSREYKQPQELEVFVQESGIEIRVGGRTSQYDWSNFSYFKPTQSHFILFLASDAIVLPKRALSQEECNALDSLLHRNLRDSPRSSHSGL